MAKKMTIQVDIDTDGSTSVKFYEHVNDSEPKTIEADKLVLNGFELTTENGELSIKPQTTEGNETN